MCVAAGERPPKTLAIIADALSQHLRGGRIRAQSTARLWLTVLDDEGRASG
jgi:hypothetical protein